MKPTDTTNMTMDEMDRLLADLLGHETPFSPPFGNLQLPSSEAIEPEIPPAIVPIHVPDGKKMHNGFLLRGGQLPVEKALERYAILILTQDFTYIHIAKNGKVVSRKRNKKKQRGTLVLPDSSPTFEKEQPFTLSLQRNQRTTTYVPDAPIQDIILYEPQPVSVTSRRTITTRNSPTNLYTPLLRQFLR